MSYWSLCRTIFQARSLSRALRSKHPVTRTVRWGIRRIAWRAIGATFRALPH